ncbi:MAG: hypothetical protein H0X38_03725 [Planctomycetes bacterium]|nr:hypothetical protein [Planctomycetota bacterium]
MHHAAIAFPFLLANLAGALDLPGIPTPGVWTQQHWLIGIGNDGLGPGGGGASDDYRTGWTRVGWDEGPICAAFDYSIFTAQNPSGAPLEWHQADPFINARLGAGRSDEATSSLAFRHYLFGSGWFTWGQLGPGLRLSGDLGGHTAQNHVHLLFGDTANDLAYEHPGIAASAFGHAAAGGYLEIAGPLALQGGVAAYSTTASDSHWQTEVLAIASGSGGGLWAGMRASEYWGHGLTTIADAVSAHEDGMCVLVGVAFARDGLQVGLEMSHNTRDNAQEGMLTVAWSGNQQPARAAWSWNGRIGFAVVDTLVPGHGIDAAFSAVPEGAPGWLQVVVGLRDQRVESPYTFDVSGQRHLLWGGVAVEPTIYRGGNLRLIIRSEAGLGWRRNQLESHSFPGGILIDGGTGRYWDVAVVRVAVGAGVLAVVGTGTLGVLALAEATGAPSRQTTVSGEVASTHEEAVDGNSAGLVIAISADWSW